MTDIARQTPRIVQPVPFLASIPIRLRRRIRSGAYAAEIDGLRFFAIAIVVVGHLVERFARFYPAVEAATRDNQLIRILSRPGVGVFLFFAISGFILATQAMKATDGPLTRAFLSAYFSRRILRIEPPYLVLLVATFALIAITGYRPEGAKQFAQAPESLALSLFASVVYLHGLVFGAFPRLFPPGWSLEVEVQFYLVAPLLFFAYFAVASRRWRLAFGLGVLFVAALESLYTPQMIGPIHVWNSLLRFFHFFWLGIMLADLRGAITTRLANLSPWAGAALGWLGFLIYYITPDAPDAPASAALLAYGLAIRAMSLGATALMFACVFAPQSAFRAFCSGPWVSLLGGACYSIYLTHLQALQVMTGQFARHAPDASGTTLLLFSLAELLVLAIVGLIFYALVERTFMIVDWPQRAWAHWRRLTTR